MFTSNDDLIPVTQIGGAFQVSSNGPAVGHAGDVPEPIERHDVIVHDTDTKLPGLRVKTYTDQNGQLVCRRGSPRVALKVC